MPHLSDKTGNASTAATVCANINKYKQVEQVGRESIYQQVELQCSVNLPSVADCLALAGALLGK